MVLINSALSVIVILKVCKMNQLFGIWHISNKILEFMINSLSNQTLQPFFFFNTYIFKLLEEYILRSFFYIYIFKLLKEYLLKTFHNKQKEHIFRKTNLFVDICKISIV